MNPQTAISPYGQKPWCDQLVQAKALLKDVFGYDTFRPLQEEIIAHTLGKRDALVVMPTGGGKSLCYQIPALLSPGLTIVVSPLISLMKDQVDQLRECGVPAVFLNSSLIASEYRRHMGQLTTREAKLLYLAPEALLNPRTLSLLSTLAVAAFAIDEAHCISAWGHDFRPEYRKLAAVRASFPQAVCTALTATATPRVREDIKNSLRIEGTHEFIGAFNRPNLFLEVAPKAAPLQQILGLLRKYPNESGIIYCASRQQTDDLYGALKKKGYAVRPYHAGLPEGERIRNQEMFTRDDIQIIVATIAFGMGINKSNVRFVIRHDLPQSLDAYYQEIGRAGRDGLPAHCLLLFSYGDIHKVKYFIQQKNGHEQMVANSLLNTLLGFAETDLCRRIPLLRYFGESGVPDRCGRCDNCLLEKKDQVDITIPAQMFLSCVKRTGELFGAGHIIDVLRGSKSQQTLKFDHDGLSTYGIGTHLTARQWRHLARQFAHQGLLTHELEHGSMKLTPKAWEILRGKELVMGRLEEAGADFRKAGESEVLDYDPALFDRLRKKRKDLADEKGLPPFAVFHDRTLREMAAHLPRTRESLARIYGVGSTKIDKYGSIFLAIIQNFSGGTHENN